MIITDKDTLKQQSAYITVEKAREMGIFGRLEEELSKSDTPGYGLAAIQIGEPVACFMYKWKDDVVRVLNPNIYDKIDPIIFAGEGCLSFPGMHFNTDRFNQISVTFDDYDTGKAVKAVLYGTEAIIFQHEFDHCAGITIEDREHHNKPKVGRNEPCPCGSGKKYKKCCGR